MSKPRTSVVLATYNAGDYLRVAIESVLAQTTGDLELIVVDDGTTDGSTDFIQCIDDERLRYLRQENAGQTRAKNRGVAEASGEFIGFCDADDYWYPDKLERQLPLFSLSDRIGVVYSSAQKIDESGAAITTKWARPYRGYILEQLFMRNFVPFGTAIVRRACLDETGRFDENLAMGIDWDLWLRIATHYEFDYLDEPTYAYRVWAGQMSTNWRGRYDSAFRIMNKYVDENPGVISPRLLRKARANTFAMKGRARVPDAPGAALRDALRSIWLDPSELFNWKTVVRVAIDAVQRDDGSGVGDWRTERYAFFKKISASAVRRTTAHLPRILMYHRFAEKTSGHRMGVDDFRWQIAYLAENCTVLPLAEALDTIERADAFRLRKPVVAITVDDGYADFLEFAFPVLQEFGVRATLFVTSGFVDRKLNLWPDRIKAILESAESGRYALGGFWAGRELLIGGEGDVEQEWHDLADSLLCENDSARDAAITAIADAVNVSLDNVDMARYSALSWQDLRYLSDQGLEIGDHTWNHTHLPSESRAELASQLARSKTCIEQNLDIRVRSFAYPNGLAGDYDDAVVEAVRDAGFDYAVTAMPSRYERRRPYEIGRLSAVCGPRRFINQIAGFGLIFGQPPSGAKA